MAKKGTVQWRTISIQHFIPAYLMFYYQHHLTFTSLITHMQTLGKFLTTLPLLSWTYSHPEVIPDQLEVVLNEEQC
jgi:hypothetical protein